MYNLTGQNKAPQPQFPGMQTKLYSRDFSSPTLSERSVDRG